MKSAKTKADCLVDKLVKEGIILEESLTDGFVRGLVHAKLKEHERDTRHTAIDNLLLLERHDFEDSISHYRSQPCTGISLNNATQTVLNTEVKDEV